jgi:hypothetical protein
MAGVQIGALHVSLSADSAAFDQGMDNAQQTADESMGKIGENAKKLAGVLAGLFAVDLIKDRIKEQIDYADGLADVAARANSTAEALSAMEYALHFNDATLEDYTGGLQKLSLNMAAAAEGSKAQAQLFETIGISLRDQDGQIRNAADVMLDFSDVLAGMNDGATKTSLAMDVLGKSAGPALLPHLSQGSDAIKELTAEAEKFNLVVSTDASKAAGQLNDNLDKLSFAATGAWRVMAVQLAPMLGSISENMLKGAQDTKVMEGAALALSTAIKVMYTGFSVSVIELKALGELIGKISAVAVSAATGEFAQAAAIWNDNSWKDKAKVDLLALGDVWQDAGQKATDSADAQAEAQAKSARTLELEKALAASGVADKPKKLEKPKDDFQYGGLKNASDEYQSVVNAENSSNINYSANQDLNQAQKDKDWESMTTDLVDTTYEDTIKKNAAKLDLHKDFISSFLTMDSTRVNSSITLGDTELEAKKKQNQETVAFFHAGLASMAQGHGKAAKAAQAIQKAQALYEIGVNTYRAAMGAYAALAPIPFVGPALGIAAAAAAIAMGASMAQGVLSGGGGAGAITGSAPPALSNTGAPTSQAEQRQTEQQNQQITYLRIGENDVLLGRTLLDLVGGALADNGGEIKNLRIIPA